MAEIAEHYGWFPGCLVSRRLPFFEGCDRKVFSLLGVKLSDVEGLACCPDPVGVRGIDEETWLCLAARNLSVFGEAGLSVLTPCSGCYQSLAGAARRLENPPVREKINQRLSLVGRQVTGSVEVSHVVQVVTRDECLQKITSMVTRPLSGLNVAVHYGCHLLRPVEIAVDHPERPRRVDRLLQALGARVVDYSCPALCCGQGAVDADPEVGGKLVAVKVSSVLEAGADCLVVICPSCFIQYEFIQPRVDEKQGGGRQLPVLYLSELLCLALGFDPQQLGFNHHRVSVMPILDYL